MHKFKSLQTFMNKNVRLWNSLLKIDGDKNRKARLKYLRYDALWSELKRDYGQNIWCDKSGQEKKEEKQRYTA